ncbi:MAG: Nif3-like dinuclear metal center hexameric protein [Syntrophobacteraceae bacterium]
MVRVRQIMDWIDSWAPFRYAQSWDNSGIQVGNPEAFVRRLLVALDPGSEVLDEAEGLVCQCVVTHHPLLFRPIQAVRTDAWPGSVIARAIFAGINIVAAHTNLDAARGGTNAQLEDLLGLRDVVPIETEAGLAGEAGYMGIGLAGALPPGLTLEALARQLSVSLGGADVKMVGDPEKRLQRAAVCTGSGGGLIGRVREAGVDVYITGDIKYHDAKLAEEIGLAIVDVGHFASEKLILDPLAEFLRSRARGEGSALEIFVSKSERDPFRVITGNC